ncbi:hypothetical protein [Janibacter cremeus]|uniref:Uncharacterized protein n=1 Tax=Janibacter cremeus TaxID=1285192 RepID=A0A852VSU0_9MICO|nr:hypothetical protein [Janibacter cremeus]NYF99376.1 hypothetical protein [Janibacter cremeus]
MQLLTDITSGDWLLARVGDWARVGGVAGTGFEAYARLLHPVPARLEDLSVTDEWGMHPVLEETRWQWSQVAERVGATMHPLVQWNRLADIHQGVDFDDGWRVGQTQEGYFDLDLLGALTEHLAAATRSPGDLVAGIWTGWGELSGHGWSVYVEEGRGLRGWLARRVWRNEMDASHRWSVAPEVRAAAARGPWLEWPEREMLPFATSTAELADPTWAEHAGIGVQPGLSGISPQLLWPTDRAWVVASEIDWDSTVVAGPRSLVDVVLADERFEAFEVREDDDLTYEGDTINPPRGD